MAADKISSDFIAQVRRWCQSQQDRVRACFVVSTIERLLVLVIRKSEKYDFALSDPIADFEMELFESKCRCEVLQISRGSSESRRSFFDESDSIQVFGDVL